MKLYLVCNESLENKFGLFNKNNIDNLRIIRPLNVYGENMAKDLASKNIIDDVEVLYTSGYSSAICNAKYLADKLDLDIKINESFNDCKVGFLNGKNMKMLKGIQNRDFNYKLPNGESLNDVSRRVKIEIDKIVGEDKDTVIFTHKRVILAYLLNFYKHDYNLDDNIILINEDEIIFEDDDKQLDVYEIEFDNKKIVNIKSLID